MIDIYKTAYSLSAPEVVEQEFVVVSGMASDEILDLVGANLKQQQGQNVRWCFLKSYYEDLKIGTQFNHIFDITKSGIIVPIRECVCTLMNLQMEAGNYYEVEFYREHPQFKKRWGWRPLGLFKFEETDVYGYRPSSYWHAAEPYLMSGENTYASLVGAEPEPDMNIIREYLETMAASSDIANYINSIELLTLNSQEGPYYGSYDAGWKFTLQESNTDDWQEIILKNAQVFKYTEDQLKRMIDLLKRTWKAPVSRFWFLNGDFTDGGFYGMNPQDYIFETGNKFYQLHFSWSD